jgi:hypothetical protein
MFASENKGLGHLDFSIINIPMRQFKLIRAIHQKGLQAMFENLFNFYFLTKV